MKPQRIVIAGAGGMAREVASLLRARNQIAREYDFLGYVVSDLHKLTDRDSREQVLGDLQWAKANAAVIDAVALGIGAPAARLKVSMELQELLPHASWPALVHPTAVFEADSASLGPGVFLGAGFVGTVNLKFEAFALCNFGCTVGHESVVGKGSVINPGANISGGVTIGSSVLIGTGAQILQYLSVGDGASVGAGAVVTRSVPPGITVVGVPAKPIIRAGKENREHISS